MALTKVKEKAVLNYQHSSTAKIKYVSTFGSYQCIDCQQLFCNGGKCYAKKQVTPCRGYTEKPVVKHIEANDIAKTPDGILCYVKKVVGERCQVLEQFQVKWYPITSLQLFKSHRECSWGQH